MVTPSTQPPAKTEQRNLVGPYIGVWLLQTSMVLSAITDAFLNPIKVPQLCARVVVALLRRLRRPDSRRRAASLALFGISVLCIRTAAAGLHTHDAVTAPLLLTLLTLATATRFVWRSGPNPAIVLTVGLGILSSPHMGHGHPAVAVEVAFAAWLCVASGVSQRLSA
jgi:hypothetical protein